MVVFTVVDYAPDRYAKLLNIALVFGASPASGPATWQPTDAWNRLERVGGDPATITATLNRLVAAVGDDGDQFTELNGLTGYRDELYLEEPVPLLYTDPDDGLRMIQAGLEARAGDGGVSNP